MSTRIRQVDAFTASPFKGNPAGVCVLDRPADEEWMQQIATEMNLSETAFLWPEGDGYRLRWFTPLVEVELCGHATLASAHVLWEDGHLAPSATARFFTHSGTLTARRNGDWIEMDFPATPAAPANAPVGLETALGARARYVGLSQSDYLLELESADVVAGLAPDFGAIAQVEARGVIVTAPANRPDCDFVSRFFAPRVGVNEDPVTGSAHCCLGPYWAEKTGKTDLTGYQASRRGGIVRVSVRGARVLLAGQAVTVLRADLLA